MTKIEWTDETWNPIVGCSIVSPGCTNCYAMAMAARIEHMRNGSHYAGTTEIVKGKAVWTGVLKQAPEHILLAPLRWKKPRRIFVNSMSDLFHESVPDDWIDLVFAIMALCPQHTFQVLTKRPKRMREYFEGNADQTRRSMVNNTCFGVNQWRGLRFTDEQCRIRRWPLPNVWLGVTAERQQEADERIPELLATPSAVRFVSIEPMLGPVNLESCKGGTLWIGGQRGCNGTHSHGGENLHTHGGDRCEPYYGDPRKPHHHHDERCRPGLDWVICGGESGPSARPLHPDLPRALRDQCAATDVAFLFKQWGEWESIDLDSDLGRREWMILSRTGDLDIPDHRTPDEEAGECAVARVGKRRAGRLLDGREHNEFPEART